MNPLFLFRKEITPVRKLLLMHIAAGGKLIEESATGNPLTFVTDVVKPFLKFELSMLPVQSGSGDPYPPGGGKNKFDQDDTTYMNKVVTAYGESDTKARAQLNGLSAGTYTLSFKAKLTSLNDIPAKATKVGVYFRSSDGSSQLNVNGQIDVATPTVGTELSKTVTFTLTDGFVGNFQNAWIYTGKNTDVVDGNYTGIVYDIQIESGSSATSYQPYSNIRPISGWTGVNAWHTGKNLLKLSADTMIYNSARLTLGFEYTETGYIATLTSDQSYAFALFKICDITEAMVGTRFTYSSSVVNSADKFVVSDSNGQNRADVTNGIITSSHVGKSLSLRIYISRGQNPTPYSVQADNCQVELGSTASSYEPYTGNTYPVVFPALGKNLLNPATLEQGGINENGTESVSSTRVRTGYIPVVVGKTYTVSATGCTAFMHYYDANKDGVGQNAGGVNKTMPEGVAFVRCFFRNSESGSTNITPSDITDAMFAEGSTAQTYEPYTNTLYGGTLDLTTGVLTATHKLFSANTSTMNNSENYPGWKNAGVAANNAKGGTFTNVVVNVGKSYSVNVNSGNDIIYLAKDYYSNRTQSEWIALELDVQIAYELATAQTYQLTPQQVQTLIGTNTVWSNANGDCSVTYLKKG